MRPLSSVSDRKASIRSITRFATLPTWPIQIGPPKINMSCASIFSRNAGHSSPSPSSEVTPGLMSSAATRTVSVTFTSRSANALASTAIIASVEDSLFGSALSVQLRAIAVSVMAVLRRGCRATARRAPCRFRSVGGYGRDIVVRIAVDIFVVRVDPRERRPPRRDHADHLLARFDRQSRQRDHVLVRENAEARFLVEQPDIDLVAEWRRLLLALAVGVEFCRIDGDRGFPPPVGQIVRRRGRRL